MLDRGCESCGGWCFSLAPQELELQASFQALTAPKWSLLLAKARLFVALMIPQQDNCRDYAAIPLLMHVRPRSYTFL